MHCHVDGGYDCGFLASLANRTEAALKEKKKWVSVQDRR